MRGNFKKFLALLSCGAVIAGASVYTGCGVKKTSVDTSKTQLWVKYYNGGVGKVWIEEAIKRFTDDYAEVSFQDGKKGVQVIADYAKETYSSEKIKNDVNNVYIGVNYNYQDIAATGAAMNITDVVNSTPIVNVDDNRNEVTESATIKSKINPERQNIYNLGSSADERYYALPFFESSMNLVYNVDLFEEKRYYFAKGKSADALPAGADLDDYDTVSDLFIQDLDEERSYGPDGRTGIDPDTNEDYSLDDGLPATYNDFRALITYMKNDKTIPFIWSPITVPYTTCIINEAWANSEGKEQFALNFSFNGTAKNLLQLNSDGTPKKVGGELQLREETNINAQNGLVLHSQKGLYDALEFAQILATQGNYYSKSFEDLEYTDAMEYFIYSKEKAETGHNGIAFIAEGTWWNNEATTYNKYKSARDKREKRFAILPLPKSDVSKIGEKNVKISERESLMFINAKTKGASLKAAKAFLRYLQSDYAMNEFSRHTDMLRAMDYELTKETLNGMTYFGVSNYKYAKSANTEWIDWVPTSNDARKVSKSLLDYNSYCFNTSKGSNPVEILKNESNLSVSSYFASIYNYFTTNGSKFNIS